MLTRVESSRSLNVTRVESFLKNNEKDSIQVRVIKKCDSSPTQVESVTRVVPTLLALRNLPQRVASLFLMKLKQTDTIYFVY